jgi:hypothetical protein
MGFVGLFLVSLFPVSLRTEGVPVGNSPNWSASGQVTEIYDLFDVVDDIAIDPNGNIYATGSSYLEYPVWMAMAITVKINSSGKIEWIKKINYDDGLVVELDSAANIYVLTARSLVKYDTWGNEKWSVYHYCTMTYGGLNVDPSGNSYIACSSGVVKFSESGIEQWRSQYKDQYGWGAVLCRLTVDPSGNVYAVGAIQGGPGARGVTIKFDSAGGLGWVADWMIPHNNPCSVVLDPAGQIIATGGGSDGALTKKYTPGGEMVWETASHRWDTGQGLGVDSAGNVYVEAIGVVQNNRYLITLIKYDPSGAEQWANMLPMENRTILYHDRNKDIMSVSPNGDTYVLGNILEDIVLAKCDTWGQVQWITQYNDSTYRYRVPIVTAIGPNQYAYIAGRLVSDLDVDGFVLKFDPSGAKQRITLIKVKSYPCGDPAVPIKTLIDKVMNLNLRTGIENNLDALLNLALKALDDLNEHNDAAVCGAMDAFIDACERQRDEALTNEEADSLIADARNIKNCLGCQ